MNEIYLSIDRCLYASEETIYGSIFLKLLQPLETFTIKLHFCGVYIDGSINIINLEDYRVATINQLSCGFYAIPIKCKIPKALSGSLNFQYIQEGHEKSLIVSYTLIVSLCDESGEVLYSFKKIIYIAEFLLQTEEHDSQIFNQPKNYLETFKVDYLSGRGEPIELLISLLSINRFLPLNIKHFLFNSQAESVSHDLTLEFQVNKPTYELGENIVLKTRVVNTSLLNVDAINLSLCAVVVRNSITTRRIIHSCVLEAIPSRKDKTPKEYISKLPLPINDYSDLIPCTSFKNVLIFYRIEASVSFSINVPAVDLSHYDLLAKEFTIKPKTFYIPLPCVLPPSRPLLSQMKDTPRWLGHSLYLISLEDQSFTPEMAQQYSLSGSRSGESGDMKKCRLQKHLQFDLGPSAMTFSDVKNSNYLSNIPVIKFLDSSSF